MLQALSRGGAGGKFVDRCVDQIVPLEEDFNGACFRFQMRSFISKLKRLKNRNNAKFKIFHSWGGGNI